MPVSPSASTSSPRRIAAVGTFDGVHYGHQAVVGFLRRQAQARGLIPTVVTFSSHPLSVVRPERVPKSLATLRERSHRLIEAGADDVIVIPFDARLRSLTAREFIKMLHDRYAVDAIVLGFNNSFGSDRLQGLDEYVRISAGLGVEVLEAPGYEHPGFGTISSTAVRHLIAAGDVASAADLLGHPFALTGPVESGKRIGRTIGFPTANLRVDSSFAIPAEGVYACRAYICDRVNDGSVDSDNMEDNSVDACGMDDGIDGYGGCDCVAAAAPRPYYPAMVNIGRRPTVDTSSQPPLTIEAHLIGFDGDLYDRCLRLEFISRIRAEQKFPSLAALTSQLAADKSAVLAALTTPHPANK